MSWYVVSYDLRRELSNADYLRLFEQLRTSVDWCHPLQSVWIIQTPRTPVQIVNILLATGILDDNDGIIVLEITGVGAYRRVLDQTVAEWLSEKLTRV